MESLNGCCILLVDDSPDNLLFMECLLEADGYQMTTADNGSAALAQVAASPPDLILLDLMMPNMNRLEVSERIQQQDEYPPIPILLVTAHREAELGQELPRGIAGVIPKPVDVEQLLKAIQAFC